jgi:catechol 2,3-dioxygenase-like lactoylglutathione lyase family enzyme
MIMSVRVGSNDIVKARTFYNAIFLALGEQGSVMPEGAPLALYRLSQGAVFIVGAAANGEPASLGNGGTILLKANDESAVDAWHAAGVEGGGSCEGAPGPRTQAGGRYGAYLRDPDGNKLGCYVGNLFG